MLIKLVVVSGRGAGVPIERIAIVGGGTAGWMAAAALSRIKGASPQAAPVAITLIESEQIGTVGVGEATIPPFVDFNSLLEIDEAELLSAVQGTFKLGIQFTNWGQIGESYLHPFGKYGYEIDGVSFHHIWRRMRGAGDPRPLHVFSPETMAAAARRFAKANPHRDDLPPINYAYHLDAGRYARFLRAYAEKRGVVRREGRITGVAQHSDSGDVASVTLDSGEVVAADLFVDCSGFRGLLIEGALKTGYEEWTHWLPCDRAVALPSARSGPPPPYTKATAHRAGWQWQVPLQQRNGNGHVYCSSFMDDEEALATLRANLDGAAQAEPNVLRFTTGRRKKFWNRNVVALGLASGFMEPLESTSIHLINTGISKLVALLSLNGITDAQRDAFNRLTAKEYTRIRDFLILHYKATRRDDSAFWNYCRTMSIPDTLAEKIDLFRANGQIFREEDELFTETSWVAVLLGQGVEAGGQNVMTEAAGGPGLMHEIGEMERSIRFLVQHMPSHQEFLARYCPARI